MGRRCGTTRDLRAPTRRDPTPRRRASGVGLLRGAATVLLAAALPTAADAACQIRTFELPVKMVGSRATATVKINGTPVPMTVDSGAYFSFLTDAAAAELHLSTRPNHAMQVEGITGKVDIGVTTVSLGLQDGEIGHVTFNVGGNDPGAGTMGLIGRNILAVSDTEYDLAHGMIRFVFPSDDCAKANMAYWAGSSPVSVVDLETDEQGPTPAIRASAKLDGVDVTVLFDTGATSVVSAQAARRTKVPESDWKPAGRIYGGGRGTARSWTAPFDRFEIGGETIRHNRLQVAEFELQGAEMLLGIDFFLSHRIYVSRKQARMYVTYNGGPVFALDRAASADGKAAASDGADDGDAVTTADGYARRGAAAASRRDFVGALADLDRACELEPTSATFLLQRAVIQSASKRPVKALADVDRALQIDPTLTEARLLRASLRVETKDREGADADLATLDQALSPQSEMRRRMSMLYEALDQPALAIPQMDRWLAVHDTGVDHQDGLNSRCWVRMLAGVQLDAALDDCNGALRGDGDNWAYLDSRGWVYLRLGRDRDALADFDASIAAHPENAMSLYGRGTVKKRLGDATGGDADLAAARKLRPGIDAKMGRVVAAATTKPKP